MCGVDLTWTYYENGYLEIEGKGPMYDWMSSPWYEYRSDIVNVDIGDGVTYISLFAFEYCRALQTIAIPDSVTSIANSAFSGCNSLESVYFGNDSGLTSIGDYAFSYCSSLKSVTIPSAVTSVKAHTFAYCTSLQAIDVMDSNEYYSSIDGVLLSGDQKTLIQYPLGKESEDYKVPDRVEIIADNAFSKCDSILSVTLSDNVKTIGTHAFESCSSLHTVAISDSVTTIGDYAFESCSLLKSVAIPAGVVSIGDSAFSACSSLQSVDFVGSAVLESLGQSVFYGCSSLQSIDVPDSVTTIGDYAFSNCTALTSVTLSKSITLIVQGMFDNCSSLQSITIPDGVTSVMYSAFSDCSALEFITLPDSVVSIGNFAFYYCTALKSVTFSDSVLNIGRYAFYGCDSLSAILFPGAIPDIDSLAFGLGNSDKTVICDVFASDSGFLEPYSNDYTVFVYHSLLSYEIVFDATGGVPDTTVLYTGSDGMLESLPEDPVKDGSVFIGWFTARTGGEQVSESTVFTEDSIVYAHWEVYIPVTGVELDRSAATMDMDDTLLLTATILPQNATIRTVAWSSSDESVATVYQNGLIKAISEGEATITVTTEDGGFTASCQITVVSQPAGKYVVTVCYMCDGEYIKEPDTYSFSDVWRVYSNPTEIKGYKQVGGVKIAGNTDGMTMTFNYERIVPAVSLTAYLTYKGSNVSVALVGDGAVPDGQVTLKMSYSEYDSELGLWVAEQATLTCGVVNAGGSSLYILDADISSLDHYDAMFSIVAQYTSADESVTETSAKIYFTPS
jgi:uncharacterized repeat protein (TIGR02543 family)